MADSGRGDVAQGARQVAEAAQPGYPEQVRDTDLDPTCRPGSFVRDALTKTGPIARLTCVWQNIQNGATPEG